MTNGIFLCYDFNVCFISSRRRRPEIILIIFHPSLLTHDEDEDDEDVSLIFFNIEKGLAIDSRSEITLTWQITITIMIVKRENLWNQRPVKDKWWRKKFTCSRFKASAYWEAMMPFEAINFLKWTRNSMRHTQKRDTQWRLKSFSLFDVDPLCARCIVSAELYACARLYKSIFL